jgi:SAM-dependent methyltransferase
LGINYATFRCLAEMSGRFTPEGRSLMLGRQKLRLTRDLRTRSRAVASWRYRRLLSDCGADPDPMRYVQDAPYSETFFRALGFGEIETLDYAPYEGAGLVHDLNQPVPEEWHGAFGFIFDGGTLEHVFDLPQAFDNIFAMLAPGGRFAAVTPLNGYPGHGFYQFSPELVWTYWKRGRGCTVHGVRAMQPKGGFVRDMADPSDTAGRQQIALGPRWMGRMPAGQILMWYEVEKPPETDAPAPVLQSDYQTLWQRRMT